MNPLFGVLIAVLTLQAIAFVIAIVSRYWVLRTETFEMRGIDVARATDLVAVYIEGVHDHRFGFPTGVFAVDADRTSPGHVVAHEINFKGSAGLGPIKFGLRLPVIGALAGMALMAEADDLGGCLFAWFAATMGAMLGLFAAVVLIVPFAFLSLVEVVLRMLMRGQISATIDKVPEVEDLVRVRFEMRGLSAFGIEHQLRKGMAPPRPPGIDPPVAAATPAGPPARVDRLNAIYLSAASVGLILSVVAFVTLDRIQPSGSGTAAAAYSYEEDSYYEEEYGYEEEEPYEESYEEEYEEPYEEEYEEEGEYGEAPTTRYEAARKMYLRYWQEIDAGNYAAAYNVYYHTFETQQGISKPEFVAAEQEYVPDIGLEHILLEPSYREPTNPNELWLYAEIPIRDGADLYAGQCRLFTGHLRMFHANGRWYYRPGEAFGRTPSFGAEGGGPRELPSSSPRCS